MTGRLYHRDMYRFERPEPSLWEASLRGRPPDARPLTGDACCEVAVIGAGYTGLSAAYHLARDHGIEARVLEAGHIGWGASGRNGGFCTIGGTAAGLEGLIRRYGPDDVRHYFQAQIEAVGLVREIIETEAIEAGVVGDAEIDVAHTPRAYAGLVRHAERMKADFGVRTETLAPEAFRERYFDSEEQYGAVLTRPSFGLDPLEYHLGLARAAAALGVVLHPHSEVLDWSSDGEIHRLRTAGGTVRARYVVFAANGFWPEHLHPAFAGRPLPLISAIVVTRPLSDAELAAHRWQTRNPAINSKNLLNYFRLLSDRRFLFGGRGHTSGNAMDACRNYARLVRQLGSIWPEWRDVEIEYRWHGFVCFTRRLTPSLGRLDDDPSVFFGFGYHGNGVNTATWAGRTLARWLAETGRRASAAPRDLPAIVRGLPGRFPLPGLRLAALQGAIAWLRFRDRRGRIKKTRAADAARVRGSGGG